MSGARLLLVVAGAMRAPNAPCASRASPNARITRIARRLRTGGASRVRGWSLARANRIGHAGD
jgi:hypothetical protein